MMGPAVSDERIAEINSARLDTAAGVRVLRDAAQDPDLWDAYVHEAVKAALFLVGVKADQVGMPRDVLLGWFEHYLVQAEAMRSPVERQRIMPVLEFVQDQLDLLLEQHQAARIGAAAVKRERPKITAAAVKGWKRTTGKLGAAKSAEKKRTRNKRDAVALDVLVGKGLTLNAAVRHYLAGNREDWLTATDAERQRSIDATIKRTRPHRKKVRTVAG
jgi:hypothetical protein